MSSGSSIRPGNFTLKRPLSVSKAPAGTRELFRATAPEISSKVMPRLSMRAGSTMASRTSVRSPLILASKISGIASNFRCKFLARRCSSRSGASPHKLTVRIGRAEKLTSSITGCRASVGNSARARSTFSKTSAMATSSSTSMSNSRVT